MKRVGQYDPATGERREIKLTEKKSRPGSEIVFQLILSHLSEECRARCDITLEECMALHRELVLREGAESAERRMPGKKITPPPEDDPNAGALSGFLPFGAEKDGAAAPAETEISGGSASEGPPVKEESPKPVTGRGATEKREIADRLDAYCARTGLGAARRVAEASKGKLTQETVRLMKERAPFPLATWRALAKALDRVEEAGKQESGRAQGAGGIIGKGAKEKREIHERLLAFCIARGPGTTLRLAAVTNGVLSDENIRDMKQAGRFELAKWKVLDAAMDHIEQQETAAKIPK